jgi:hypothetical protein
MTVDITRHLIFTEKGKMHKDFNGLSVCCEDDEFRNASV